MRLEKAASQITTSNVLRGEIDSAKAADEKKKDTERAKFQVCTCVYVCVCVTFV
jgi:hypothetical protein